MLIRTKRQYVRLAQEGLAGNTPQTWNSVDSFLAESVEDVVGIRCLDPGSQKFTALVSRHKLAETVKTLGLKPGEFYLTATILPAEVILSGELSWVDGDWVFYHSFLQLPMRKALSQKGIHAVGSTAVWNLLFQHATVADIEDLHLLFDRYTVNNNYPVIELTVTRSDCGIIPHRNVLVWEIRHY